ncbi:MAG: response regulator [Myxococcota bacterium]
MDPVEPTGELPTLDLQRRVFVALADDAVRADLVGRLERAGYLVHAQATIDGLHEQVLSWRPELLVLGETYARGTGRQALLKLRSSGATFSVPVVAALEDVSVPNILRWLRVGVVEVWRLPWTRDPAPRVKTLLDECLETLVQTAGPRTRLLAFARRAKLEGTVVIYPDTPFEARASFVGGELKDARFGPLEGVPALDQMLELDDAPVRWAEGTSTDPTGRALAKPGPRTSVLVVEDEDSVRALVSRQLASAGFKVETAADGAEGLQRALAKSYDLIVVDLGLPRLDGWGLLRQLREDVVARESAVVVLSAHDDEVDTLKAARAGARAYLKKSGRAKELLQAASLLAGPRATTWESLEAFRETRVELRAVGPVWLLRALAELDCAGRLELEDALGRYEVTVAKGQFLEAVAQTGSLRVTGPVALEAVLSSRGEGRFVFAEMKVPAAAPWLYDVVDVVCDGLRKDHARLLARAIQDPGRLYFNEELAQLFARLATPGELKVLEGVRQAPSSFDALAEQVGLEAEDVTAALGELLRRGVLSVQP